jgi:hypothetical protein
MQIYGFVFPNGSRVVCLGNHRGRSLVVPSGFTFPNSSESSHVFAYWCQTERGDTFGGGP